MQVQLLRKTDPLVKTLETVKRAYFTAKVVYDETLKVVHEENKQNLDDFEKECEGPDREEVLNSIIDKMDAIEAKYKLKELQDLLTQAENLLIDTGADIIKILSPDRWTEISIIFERKKDPCHFAVRQKVIDLTLKLDPTR